jgi:hypothetical protein
MNVDQARRADIMITNLPSGNVNPEGVTELNVAINRFMLANIGMFPRFCRTEKNYNLTV